MRFRSFVLAAVVMLANLAAHATNITYTFSEPVPNFYSATATGTITTDGTIGAIASSDIVTYAITVASYGNSITLTPSNSALTDNGAALTGTGAGLFYNFSTPGAGFGFFDSVDLYGIEDVPGAIDYLVKGQRFDPLAVSGNMQVGAAVSTVTPEPSSIALLGTGLLGFAGVLRKRWA